MRLWVLLFNIGTDNEGIHSLLVNGKNTVLGFKEEDDAIRFAGLLEAQDFPCPSVERIDEAEIQEFCDGAGYELSIVEEGALAIPPDQNVEKTDWQAEGKTKDTPEADVSPEALEIEMFRRRLEGLL